VPLIFTPIKLPCTTLLPVEGGAEKEVVNPYLAAR
jgi:hypothetical protein